MSSRIHFEPRITKLAKAVAIVKIKMIVARYYQKYQDNRIASPPDMLFLSVPIRPGTLVQQNLGASCNGRVK